jgi:hypothetical protein
MSSSTPAVIQILSEIRKSIEDVMVSHERVMNSFNSSLSIYYHNAPVMARMPGNYAMYERRTSSHIELMHQHYEFIFRTLRMLETAMSALLVSPATHSSEPQTTNRPRTFAEAAFSNQYSFRQPNTSATPTPSTTPLASLFEGLRPTAAAAAAEQPQTRRRSRHTDSLIQSLVSNILNPSTTERHATTTSTNGLSLSDMFSVFASRDTFPLVGRSVYEFEATIPIGTFEPSVNLTLAEVEEHTEMVEYHASDAAMTESRCPITYDDFVEGERVRRIRFCQHYFKDAAIMDWLRNTRGSCPVCRHNLLDSTDDEPAAT